MKTKLTLILIICLGLLGLGLIAQSKDSTENKNCIDCCSDGNCQNGEGTWIYANGDKYTGSFYAGKKEGEGIYTYSNGDKYVGDFEDGKQNGEGTYTYANGDIYVGEWNDGIKNGEGTYTFINGEKYTGEIQDSKPNGIGTYTYSNRENYIGEWKNGKRNGQGLYTFANGTLKNGEWKDGQFLTANSLEKVKKKAREWSAYQGYMNWSDAKEKCISIGMKLPRRREFKSAFRAKLIEPWKADGTYYWTSDENSGDFAYFFVLDYGKVDFFTKDVARHVRCTR